MLPDFELCQKIFKENDLELTSDVYAKLDIYADFLFQTNKKINLTAITEPVDMLIKHFLDSIYIIKYINLKPGIKVIDVGTGAGFPLLPVKIYYSDIDITLLDGNNKRVNFLKELCEKLEIKAECLHERAELLAKNDSYREKYDIATARAVSAMPVLSEYCLPFVKTGGIFCAMKGPTENISDAASAIKLLGGKISDDISYEINKEKNALNDHRRIIIVKKISPTPTKYPRSSGKISSKPL